MADGFVTCNKCNQVVVTSYRICAVCGNDLLLNGGSRPVTNAISICQPEQNKKMYLIDSGSRIGPGIKKTEVYSPYYEGNGNLSAAEKVTYGIDVGISIGARIYGGVLLIGGIAGAVATANPALLLVSAYGVYLMLGGSFIIF